MKLKRLLHPCGPFYAINGTVACACSECGCCFDSWELAAHTEISTGRQHVHCPACSAIRLVTPQDHLRRLARWCLRACDQTPHSDTAGWYYWHPDWHLHSWYTIEDGSSMQHHIWLGPDGQYWVLAEDEYRRVSREPAPPGLVRDYDDQRALWQAIDDLVTGRISDRVTRDGARRAGLDIILTGEQDRT